MATPIPNNSAAFTLEEIAQSTRGKVIGNASRHVRGVQTDSRRVESDNLFVALKGERFDGHDFIPEVLKKGASALVSNAILPDQGTGVVVKDTLIALGQLARTHRQRWGGKVVAITGSVGKTTTKNLVAHGLNASGARALSSQGNLNNRIGLPMSIFQLESSHDTAVMELGASVPGEIAQLAEIAEPDVAVVTAIGMAHGQGLGTLDAIADEKMSLVRALGLNGVAVVNGDSPYINARLGLVKAKRIIRFGSDAACEVRLLRAEPTEQGTHCEWLLHGKALQTTLRVIGQAAASNATAALAVFDALGRDPDACLRAIAQMEPVEGRMNLLQGLGGALLIDDTYNANPDSLRAAFETAALLSAQRKGRLYAVLGDMRELGDREQEAHREVGEWVAQHRVARLVTFGPAMEHATFAASAHGIDSVRVMDPALAAKELGELGPRDVVLVKGSRTMHMEDAVRALRSNKETQR